MISFKEAVPGNETNGLGELDELESLKSMKSHSEIFIFFARKLRPFESNVTANLCVRSAEAYWSADAPILTMCRLKDGLDFNPSRYPYRKGVVGHG